MSLPKELGELQDKRAKLEDESRSLKEEQKKLEERAKVLEEKIIEELKNSNKATRQAISQLESMTNELEQRLKQTSETTETSKPSEEPTSKSFFKKCANCEKDIPIASEECQYCGTKQTHNVEPTQEASPENSESKWIEEPVEEREEDVVTVAALEDSTLAQQEVVGEDPKRTNGKKKGRFF